MTDLSVLMDRYKKKMEKVASESVLDLGTRIKEGTPKDTGRARQSWSDNGPLVVGKLYQYSSNLVYMRRLEYGHSAQAPAGMVRINTIKWPQIVDKYAKSI